MRAAAEHTSAFFNDGESGFYRFVVAATEATLDDTAEA